MAVPLKVTVPVTLLPPVVAPMVMAGEGADQVRPLVEEPQAATMPAARK